MLAFFTGYLISTVLIQNQENAPALTHKIVENRLRLSDSKLELVQIGVDSNETVKSLVLTKVSFPGLISGDPEQLKFAEYSTDHQSVNVTYNHWSVEYFGISKSVQYQHAHADDVLELLHNDHVKLRLKWYNSDAGFDILNMLRKFTDVLSQITKYTAGKNLQSNMKFFILGCTVGLYDNSEVQIAFYHGNNQDINDETIFLADQELVAITFSSLVSCVPPDFLIKRKTGKLIRIELQKSNLVAVTEMGNFSSCQKSHVEEIMNSLNFLNSAQVGNHDMLNQALASLLIFSKTHNLSIPWFLMGQMSGVENGSIFAWSNYCLDPQTQSNHLTLSLSPVESAKVFQTLVIMNLAHGNGMELCETTSLAAELRLKPNIGRQLVQFANLLTDDVSNYGTKSPVQISTLPISMLSPDFRKRMSKMPLNRLVVHARSSSSDSYVKPCSKCLLYDTAYFLDKFLMNLPRKPEKIGDYLSALVGHIKLSTSSLKITNNGTDIDIFDEDNQAYYKHTLLHFCAGEKKLMEYHESPIGFHGYLSKLLIERENVAVKYVEYFSENQQLSFSVKFLKIRDTNRQKVLQCIQWANLNIIFPQPSCNVEVTQDKKYELDHVTISQKPSLTTVNLTNIFSSQKILFDGYQQKARKVSLKVRNVLNYLTDRLPEIVDLILSDQSTMLDDCVFFDFLTYSTNITIKMGHYIKMVTRDVIFKTIDLCLTLDGICNKMSQRLDHLMLWLRSHSRPNRIFLGNNETHPAMAVTFVVSKLRLVSKTGKFAEFREYGHQVFQQSHVTRRDLATKRQPHSNNHGSFYILTRRTKNTKICMPENLSILYDRDEYTRSVNICMINDLSCETPTDLIGSLTQVDVSSRLVASEFKKISNDFSTASFTGERGPTLFYDIDSNQCQETVIQLPYCTRNVRISDQKGHFVLFVADSSNSTCRNNNITFTLEYASAITIIVTETIDQITGIETTITNKSESVYLCEETHVCFIGRCLTILIKLVGGQSADMKNPCTIGFSDGFWFRFPGKTAPFLVTYITSYYFHIIDAEFHNKIIRLSLKLNHRRFFVAVRHNNKNPSSVSKQIFYLNMRQKTRVAYEKEMVFKKNSPLQFVDTDPACESVIHSINTDTVVSIRANQYYDSRFVFEPVNIEFSTLATITVDLNSLNHDDAGNEEPRFEVVFEQTGLFEYKIFVNENNIEKDSHLMGIVKIFYTDKRELIPSERIRLFLKNQLVRFSQEINGKFIVSNVPVKVPLNTEISVLSEEYTRFPCELETDFLLSGLSFLRIKDNLIMKNVHSNQTVNAENRFTLILLDFFVFPFSFRNITVHFRKDTVVLCK